ncbi:MAG: hypothetical protein IKL70_06930 [Oscillospiraceae bacterium]|nr:hypothetical protein [Oscillospiraceae bacterium]MBR6696128.1 hypothetical protein [Oscillospiraceae bacterium]
MDVIVNKKKDQFLEVLYEAKLSPIFEFRIAENDVIFRSIQPMKESVPSQILFKLDASIYNDCMVTFGSVENKKKRGKILELMNELNSYNRVCKYCISEQDDLYFTYTYVAEPEKFDPKLFLTLGTQLYRDFVENQYQKFEAVM